MMVDDRQYFDVQKLLENQKEEIAKIKFHISMLNSYQNYSNNPIGSLVIEFDWSEEDLDKAHDIFEKYDKKILEGRLDGNLHSLMEKDFNEDLNLGYQEVKSVVLAFFRESRWVTVCVEFVKSYGYEPVEFSEIISYIKKLNQQA
ncbi:MULTISPECIES: hypothetical protein [Neisseria]|uniref:Uncharacterized protein n=1 Tax=Neisseria mucosa C102 TaxID=435832 RepID=A0ABN0CCI4_NEIMU|nr:MULTISPECIES: hypothetical protein [Neisseria]EFV81057.1 hypothetical protein HMPREF0604_00512 [Neisseria mucosa C102]QKI21858.1 hypothetical protein FOC66_02935 [Neisseria mucosa]